jgi:hypothetical protein
MTRTDDADVLEVAAKVALVMAAGYDPIQAIWACRTAKCGPGVPVAFGSSMGGREQVTYYPGGRWEIQATS